jgi:hypothetical protein
MTCVTCGAALLAMVMLASSAQPRRPRGTAPFYGRLYAAVSRWEPADLDAARDSAQVPSQTRPRFERFVRCVGAIRSRLADASDFFGDSAMPHQQALERALVCSIEAPNRSRLAAEYAAHATILYEWEGVAPVPLGTPDVLRLGPLRPAHQ